MQAGVQRQGGRALINLMQSLICLLSVKPVEYLKRKQTHQQPLHVTCLRGSSEFLITHPITDNQRKHPANQKISGQVIYFSISLPSYGLHSILSAGYAINGKSLRK